MNLWRYSTRDESGGGREGGREGGKPLEVNDDSLGQSTDGQDSGGWFEVLASRTEPVIVTS